MESTELLKSVDYQAWLEDVLHGAKGRDYAGYSKFDALNSPFLKKLSFNSPWLRLFWIQLVKESRVNLRPLFSVEQSRNPKGIALFARGYLFLHEKTKQSDYLEKAKILLEWLIQNRSLNQTNFCWGYNFAWQDIPPFFQDRGEPNCIVSVFVGEALIHAYRITGNEKYLDTALSVARFLTEDLPILYENDQERAIAYTLREENSIVLNSQVLTGAYLAKVGRHTNEKEFFAIAQKLLNFTYNRKTKYNAWFYTEPRNRSPIHHDNYHTGGILDGFLEYQEETGDNRYDDGFWKALEYYKKNLFEANGAPRWMNNRKFPHDIHGAAQGIITFAKAGRYKKEYTRKAQKIAQWTHQHLYRTETKDFAYRKGRFMKWNYSLMRWCNAWMARALGELMQRENL